MEMKSAYLSGHLALATRPRPFGLDSSCFEFNFLNHLSLFTKYVFGFIVFTIGSGLSYFSYRSLAALSQRWLVFVPAGVVLHDNMVLADPFLIRKSMIKGIGPALASTDGLDLTMSSIGMSLEVELYEPANLSYK